MKLLCFSQTSAVAGGGEENLKAVGEDRAANAFAGGAEERAAQAQFARLLTTRGQRAAAARARRAGR
jgi:hypothetical protein